jgi:hypothetical protein
MCKSMMDNPEMMKMMEKMKGKMDMSKMKEWIKKIKITIKSTALFNAKIYIIMDIMNMEKCIWMEPLWECIGLVGSILILHLYY